MKTELRVNGANQTIVTLGTVELFYSYRSLIAVRAHGGASYVRLFDPSYRRYSATTTKHAGAMGCKGFPDATSPEAFTEAVALALQTAAGSN